jgi:hypothetical protein
MSNLADTTVNQSARLLSAQFRLVETLDKRTKRAVPVRTKAGRLCLAAVVGL